MDPISTKVIEATRELLRAFGYFVDNLWHVKDVHLICEQLDLPKITDEEAMEVFVIANAQFDGERGISWPELEKALRISFERKTVLNTMCESDPA